MGKRCTVARCSNKYMDGVSLFKFPLRKEIREQWIKQVKRNRAGWTYPSDYSVMCSCHFTDKCFETSKFTSQGDGVYIQKTKTPHLVAFHIHLYLFYAVPIVIQIKQRQ